MKNLIFRYSFMVLLAVFFIFFLLMPIFTVVEQGLDYGLLQEIFKNPIYVHGLLNSFKVAIFTTLLVIAGTLPLAIIYDRYNFWGKNICIGLMLLPMILPPFVGALGVQQILGHYGILNKTFELFQLGRIDFLGGSGKFWAVCVVEALHLYPILFLNLISSLGSIDPANIEAAQNLGISPWRRFFCITLPLIRPGLFAGSSIVLIWSFTELGTPLMFGYNRITSVQIYNGIGELDGNPVPLALVLLMLLLSCFMYIFSKICWGGNQDTVNTKGQSQSNALGLSFFKSLPMLGLFVAITFLAVMPHIALILCAFSTGYYNSILPDGFTLNNFALALSNDMVIPSIINSLKYSSVAMIIAVALGITIAVALMRWKLRGAWFLDLITMLPLAVPGIVLASGFMGMSIKYDYKWVKYLFDPLNSPLLLLSVAYAVRRLPYVVRSVSAGLQQTPQELEYAASNLGVNKWRIMTKITLPLILGNVIIGALFAFSFSMLEVSDSLILAQKVEFYPITKALFELSQILGSGPIIACAFGVWAMAFLGVTLLLGSAILGKRIGSLFKM